MSATLLAGPQLATACHRILWDQAGQRPGHLRSDGSSYAFAFSISGVGVLLHYFFNVFLIQGFVSRRAPGIYMLEGWEEEALGRGIVPRWVSGIGLIGMVFVPSGIIVALLLVLDIVQHR